MNNTFLINAIIADFLAISIPFLLTLGFYIGRAVGRTLSIKWFNGL